MRPTLTFALAQAGFTVGHFEGNIARLAGIHGIAATGKADMAIFSEMAITGYPVEDLALCGQFQETNRKALEALARNTENGTAMLLGGLWREGAALYNAAFLMDGGKIIHVQPKHHLPDYGVFDESRLFAPGPMPEPVEWRGIRLGILVCEDMWRPDVAAHLQHRGAELLIVLNASPFELGKDLARRHVASQRVRETGLPLIYVNQVGGQDELAFDGGSFALSTGSEVHLRLKEFQEDFALLQCRQQENGWEPMPALIAPALGEREAIYRAMMIALRDFVMKNGFAGVVLGLSGGIDSALSAAVAVDALGSERLHALMLPSPITSRESIEDAAECAKRLGMRLDTVPIEPGMTAFNDMLSPLCGGDVPVVLTGNNQTRIRASILNAVSSREKLLLLNTGNKSEMAVGYTTIYGDMCGGYSVLKDLYKTTVYEIARWRNAQGEVIPPRILSKPPSAELVPNQTDQDVLPPYDVLDAVLARLIEERLSVTEIVEEGFERGMVEKVAAMLFFAEHKRRQAPPGVKITRMAFGRDRRFPLTSGWRE